VRPKSRSGFGRHLGDARFVGERAAQGFREVGHADPLGSPVGRQFVAPDAPDLLRIGLEIDLVQDAAETAGDPLFERHGVLPVVRRQRAEIGEAAADGVSRAERARGLRQADSGSR
jgi:hypothetical protein